MSTKQPTLLIGLDDTDRKGSPGTGRLSRRLADQLIKIGCKLAGITRHQFLVHPDIPYTSHNSGACLALDGPLGLPALRNHCLAFLRTDTVPEAQPGLCIAYQNDVPAEATAFGSLAQRQVVKVSQARDLATRTGLWLGFLTPDASGLIGAISSVGLRAGGNDGRFIHLSRIRQATGTMTVAQIQALGVDHVVDLQGRPLDTTQLVSTMDWVRPRLENHQARFYVQKDDHADLWLPADRSKSKKIKRTAPDSAHSP